MRNNNTKKSNYSCRVNKRSESKKSEIDDSKIKIVHTMADGTVRDSVEGYEIPYNETTAVAYWILAEWSAKKYKKDDK